MKVQMRLFGYDADSRVVRFDNTYLRHPIRIAVELNFGDVSLARGSLEGGLHIDAAAAVGCASTYKNCFAACATPSERAEHPWDSKRPLPRTRRRDPHASLAVSARQVRVEGALGAHFAVRKNLDFLMFFRVKD